MIKIRLQRHGARHAPFYRMVVTPSETRRDGRYIEVLGTYNPQSSARERELDLKLDRIDHWLDVGAQPTDTARSLIRQSRLSPEEWLKRTEAKAAAKAARLSKKKNPAPVAEAPAEEEVKPEEATAEEVKEEPAKEEPKPWKLLREVKEEPKRETRGRSERISKGTCQGRSLKLRKLLLKRSRKSPKQRSQRQRRKKPRKNPLRKSLKLKNLPLKKQRGKTKKKLQRNQKRRKPQLKKRRRMSPRISLKTLHLRRPRKNRKIPDLSFCCFFPTFLICNAFFRHR